MLINHKLKKLGFKKEDLNGMKIDDIIKLGEMGYTKAEIEEMQKAPENDVNAQLEELKNQIIKLTNAAQGENIREPVGDAPDPQQQIDEALTILGGGSVNGKNETA